MIWTRRSKHEKRINVLWCRGVNFMCFMYCSFCLYLMFNYFLNNFIWFVVIWTRRSKHEKLINMYCGAAGWIWCLGCSGLRSSCMLTFVLWLLFVFIIDAVIKKFGDPERSFLISREEIRDSGWILSVSYHRRGLY